MKKVYLLAVIITMGMVLLTACGGNGDNEEGALEEESKGVITIGNAPYEYETPVIEVTKQIAEEQGYEVEVVEGDVGFLFMALAEGDIDAWPGVWLPGIHKTFQEKYGDQYELGSAIFEDAPVGWVVPEYVEADSIADLAGNEELVNGKLIGFEPGSGMMLVSEDVVDEYGLDLDIVSGNTSSMMAEVDYAINHDEPILFLGWRPHTMFRNYDIKVLEDPKGLWDVDSYYWGINNDFQEKAPEIYNVVKNFKMSIDDNEAFSYKHESEETDYEQLAQEWIEEHQSEIDTWLEEK